MAKLVLSVGQCSADDSRIRALVDKELGADLERAASAEEATRLMAAKKYDLVLVNRLFDWGGDSGAAFIGAVKKAGDQTPIMLVSNYADAQAKAVANGALMGFGKNALGSGEVAARLREVTGTADLE